MEWAVTISNLRLDSGKSSTVGAIHNSGRTTLINTSFTNNRASNSAEAIFNKYGSLNIIGSSFTNNKVSGGFGGAFIIGLQPQLAPVLSQAIQQ